MTITQQRQDTAPLLGLIASAHGPRGALLALLVIPPLALLCGTLLREPA
jgi:FSR family fosmidomycin resistance protein-like MFS transporter